MTRPAYEPWVREILRCPVGLHELIDVLDEDGQAALQCAEDCGAPGQRRRYPMTDGAIPTLLADDATLVMVDGADEDPSAPDPA